MAETVKNDLALDGIEFVEYAAPQRGWLDNLFKEFGFSKLKRHAERDVSYFNQGDIHFLVNDSQESFAAAFTQLHGPCVCSMGWRVRDAKTAYALAIERGAKPAKKVDYQRHGKPMLAIEGIGGSVIYFIDDYHRGGGLYEQMGFIDLQSPEKVPDKGFQVIDHLTNNVPQGTMAEWSDFYKNVFGFYEIRYFDIRGAKTGLTSYALKSPCGKFCIPINEGTEEKSQINEYLREYKGAGVQHIALTTDDIVKSVESLSSTSIETLDIDDEYYKEVFDRVPGVKENHDDLQRLNILVDGDKDGYLLQIFTKNIIGPIFIEIIQRKNHFAFGEGNFGALFRSIERDQERRGIFQKSS